MRSFRNPKYLDRYEDVVFDLEQTLDAAPANAAHQTKTGLRFVADLIQEKLLLLIGITPDYQWILK